MAKRFGQFDKNADGKLTREEIPMGKIVGTAEADKDGRLTREDLAADFRTQQRSPSTSPKPSTTPVPAANVDIVEMLNVPCAIVPGGDPNLLSVDIHAPEDAQATPVAVGVHGGDLGQPLPHSALRGSGTGGRGGRRRKAPRRAAQTTLDPWRRDITRGFDEGAQPNTTARRLDLDTFVGGEERFVDSTCLQPGGPTE